MVMDKSQYENPKYAYSQNENPKYAYSQNENSKYACITNVRILNLAYGEVFFCMEKVVALCKVYRTC
jgi:hypothetical protein